MSLEYLNEEGIKALLEFLINQFMTGGKMKRVLYVIVLFLIFGLVGQTSALDIDLTGTTTEIKAADTLRITKLKVTGYTGTYWVDFQ